jgi:proteasome lid subunit RPN8/RPN11
MSGIAEEAAAEVRRHAEEAYPDECCGALIATDGTIVEAYRLPKTRLDRRAGDSPSPRPITCAPKRGRARARERSPDERPAGTRPTPPSRS